ncbi:MAG: DUF5069 domain-containing protein [Nitrospirales bacterium]
MIRIRKPTAHIADCCWLPRFIDKARLWQAGDLSFFYRLAFCSSLGLDGHFLKYFQLRKHDFLKAVQDAEENDDSVVEWFLAQTTVTAKRIAEWNAFAPHIGERGRPGYWLFHLLKWLLYPKTVRSPVNTLFQAIDQDEGT